MKKFVYAIVLLGYFSASAQEGVPLIKPEVAEFYVMFKKTILRRMDLREKQNSPFFSTNGEITTLIFEAVKNGQLKAYKSDSCLNIMSDEEFNSATQNELEDQSGGFGGFSGGFGDDTPAVPAGPKFQDIPPQVFDVIYIKEDLIFDRNRSRMYNYIRTISIALPTRAGIEFNPAGFEKKVAHFKYQDLLDLFRGPMADRAIWYNNYNNASHLNFSDAFELRMFNAPIVQISNAENTDIRQEYQDLIAKDPLNAIIIQHKYEYDLMEYESELWEY
ncbi:MAG: gliding motility protein GldN [Cyclobacteriaceae bacterium]|nr:gliding motility protein GldN [Cyclobacteriaceae bacterium]